MDHYSSQDLPVTILTVHIKYEGAPPSETETDALIMNQAGSMIKNLVRVYDVTGRLRRNIYAIAFPGQPSSSLEPVVERLTNMSESVKFGPDSSGQKTYSLSFTIDLSELGHGVTGESWLAQVT